MPWPLFILLPILLLIAAIAIAPVLLTSPKEYIEKRKKVKETITIAKSEKTLFGTALTIRQAPTMLGYNQYRISGFPMVYFKENYLYYNAFGLIKFVLEYNEIENIRIEKGRFIPYITGHSFQLKLKLKDKGRASLIFGIGRNEKMINEIEKAIGIPIERMI